MVELVDTLVSGTSARKGMEVQVFFRGHKKTHRKVCFFLLITNQMKAHHSANGNLVLHSPCTVVCMQKFM